MYKSTTTMTKAYCPVTVSKHEWHRRMMQVANMSLLACSFLFHLHHSTGTRQAIITQSAMPQT